MVDVEEDGKSGDQIVIVLSSDEEENMERPSSSSGHCRKDFNNSNASRFAHRDCPVASDASARDSLASSLVADACLLDVARLSPTIWLNDSIINFFDEVFAQTLINMRKFN